MGRYAEGWRIRWKGELAYVRFSVRDQITGETVRAELPTGERDPGKASSSAARIYAETIAGKRSVVRRRRTSVTPLAVLVSEWLAALEKTHPASTCKTYAGYARKWLGRWKHLEEIDGGAVAEYARDGLTRALVATIRKEVAALLGNFFEWAVELQHLDESDIPPRPVRLLRKSTGIRTGPQRAVRVEATPNEVRAFLDAVPEWAGGKRGERWRARDALIVAYETGLRPGAVGRLTVPEHWIPGSATLRVNARIDKVRYARELPLTAKAIEALTRSAGGPGVIFGEHDYRTVFRLAAEHVPEGFSLYDLRHGRGQHLTDAGAPLPGVAYLLGHKRITTTNIYVRASQRLAETALAAGEVPQEQPGDSGEIVGKRFRRLGGRRAKR